MSILFLPGLGCAKNNFSAKDTINFEFPELQIDELVEFTNSFIQENNLDDIILIGHSMGGIVGLLFAEKYPRKIKAFINVEGNLNSDDCFISRKTIEYSFDDFLKFGFVEIKKMVAPKNNKGFQKYAEQLKNVDPKTFYNQSASIVEYSTHGDLLNRFINLKIPKLFIYGSENNSLSYLQQLRDSGINVIEISSSNHWPMIDNPNEFYNTIENFLNKKSP